MIDQEAFDALYRNIAPALRAYAARVLGSVSAADDILQETFLRYLCASANVDPSNSRAYLFRIASNLIADRFRRQKRETTVNQMPDEPTSAGDSSAELDMIRLFQSLSLRERQLLWLAHVEGATHRDVAAALGLKESSVPVLLFRARRRLEALLEEE